MGLCQGGVFICGGSGNNTGALGLNPQLALARERAPFPQTDDAGSRARLLAQLEPVPLLSLTPTARCQSANCHLKPTAEVRRCPDSIAQVHNRRFGLFTPPTGRGGGPVHPGVRPLLRRDDRRQRGRVRAEQPRASPADEQAAPKVRGVPHRSLVPTLVCRVHGPAPQEGAPNGDAGFRTAAAKVTKQAD